MIVGADPGFWGWGGGLGGMGRAPSFWAGKSREWNIRNTIFKKSFCDCIKNSKYDKVITYLVGGGRGTCLFVPFPPPPNPPVYRFAWFLTILFFPIARKYVVTELGLAILEIKRVRLTFFYFCYFFLPSFFSYISVQFLFLVSFGLPVSIHAKWDLWYWWRINVRIPLWTSL